MRPILRYHGGKWRLAKWIISHFPNHKIYVEPFGGAMSVLLQKPRSYAEVYNDLDGEIVNVFRVLRDDPDELFRLLELTPFSRYDFNLSYEDTDSPLERARRTITRSFLGFGSAAATKQTTGFRANSNRSGTTPAGDWRNYPNHLRDAILRLQGVVLENKPYQEIIERHDTTKTLFYLDPPYTHNSRTSNKAYQFEMTNKDHIQLAHTLKNLKGEFVLSCYNSPLYTNLYKDYPQSSKNSLADNRLPRTETLIYSYIIQTQLAI